MTAIPKNIVIEQGATFVWGMTLFDTELVSDVVTIVGPRDLTDYDARMQIRKKRGETPQVDCTVDNGRIVLGRLAYGDDPGDDDPTNGRLMVIISDEETDVFTAKTAVYDLEAHDPVPAPDGFTFRIHDGSVEIRPNVTQTLPPDGNDVVL